MAYAALISAGMMCIWMLLLGRYYWNVATSSLPLPVRSQAIIAIVSLILCLIFNPLLAWGFLAAKKWARLMFYTSLIIFPLPLLTPMMASNLKWAYVLALFPFVAGLLYMITRKEVAQYFSQAPVRTKPQYSRAEKTRRALRSSLYVVAGIVLVLSFHGIATGLGHFYPQLRGMENLSFLALPVLLVAEGLGASPGAPGRLFNLSASLTLAMGPNAVLNCLITLPGTSAAYQLHQRNWALGLASLAAMLYYLKRRQRRQMPAATEDTEHS
ncbi:hypothetical protein I5R65_03370 [Herbaspirillum sp. AP02]|uniref:hypothetical protein n=1 Tax=unclassified Herbaspirillum TaxID=2624150 RepID=UPI0015DA20E8|nr:MULTISPECIES: hypothetical protein [unclassified Herbaspirillum]MBG7618497.1 hypothetical protein [Herbaspirillum sp. AP02]NZD68657.1 hypothetical protein [Herbaspirillum sp. AP21]